MIDLKFFDPKKHKHHESFKVEKCCRIEEFNVKMAHLSDDRNLEVVAISVVENYVLLDEMPVYMT